MLFRSAKQIIGQFGTVKVSQVGRSQIKHADSLATLASLATEDTPRLVTIELIREPSISVKSIQDQARVEVAKVAVANSCWMNLIIDFLTEDKVPDDEDEAKKIRRVAPWYWLSSNHKLYRRSFAGPYILCLHPEKVSELLTELHEGVCGSHVGGRSLVHRAMTQGFWWPMMQKDAAEYVRRCE